MQSGSERYVPRRRSRHYLYFSLSPRGAIKELVQPILRTLTAVETTTCVLLLLPSPAVVPLGSGKIETAKCGRLDR